MKRQLLAIGLLAICAGTPPVEGAAPDSAAPVRELRCEYLSNPLGIDVPKPRLSWPLNPAGNVRGQSAYRVLVASSPALLQEGPGRSLGFGPRASAQIDWVEYAGKALTSGQQALLEGAGLDRCRPELAMERPGYLVAWGCCKPRTGTRNSSASGARTGSAEGTPLPFPWLRKTFTLTQKPARAVAYVNPLGYYELYVNGKKVDDHVLSPAVSDYSKRNLYVTHEIADYLVPGKNVVALWLGRGWYVKGHPGRDSRRPAGACATRNLHAAMGARSEIVTDESWKLRESPLIRRRLGHGVRRLRRGALRRRAGAARLEFACSFDDSSWQQAAVFEPPEVVTRRRWWSRTASWRRSRRSVYIRFRMAAGSSIWARTSPAGWRSSCPRLRRDLRSSWSTPTSWSVISRPRTGREDRRCCREAATRRVRMPRPARARGARPGRSRRPRSGLRRPGRGAGAQPARREAAAAEIRPRLPNTFNQRDEIVGNGAASDVPLALQLSRIPLCPRDRDSTRPPAVSDATGYLIRTAYDRAGEFSSSNDLFNQIYQMVTGPTKRSPWADTWWTARRASGWDMAATPAPPSRPACSTSPTGGLYNRWLANWRDAQDPATRFAASYGAELPESAAAAVRCGAASS